MIYGENVRFGLIERFRQVKPAPKPNAAPYSYNPVRLETTGNLSVEVWNYYSGGPQKVWRDRENSKLEAQIPRCVAGLMRIALKERADDRGRQEKERAHQIRVDEITAELEKIRAEEKRIKLLRRDAGAWHRAERIRKFVAAVRESGAKDSEWLTWAELQADRLDPLKEKPKSVVDDKEEVVKRLRKVEWGW